jgi:hypothetical protein
MVCDKKRIDSFCERGPLWNLKIKNYDNRDLSRKLWNEIALEMENTRK